MVNIESVVESAKTLLGTKYIIGGNTLSYYDGLDCSGFIQYIFALNGYEIPRTVREQYKLIWNITPMSCNNDKPNFGDLVFNKSQTHVGIYIGDNKFIHAPKVGDVVKVSELDGSGMKMFGGIILD